MNQPTHSLTFHVMWKVHEKPNPLTPFPTREGGKFKVSPFRKEKYSGFRLDAIHFDLSPNLSPKRREALNLTPLPLWEGAGG